MTDKLPERIFVERDPETDEKRWFTIEGMGAEYVRAGVAADTIARLVRERDEAAAFISDLVHMQSSRNWTRSIIREAAAEFLALLGRKPLWAKDSTPAFTIAAEQKARADKAERERQDAALEYKRTLDALQEANERLTARADRAEEQLRQAMKVIEPFGPPFSSPSFDQLSEYAIVVGTATGDLTVGQFRAARTFLASLAKEPQT